MSQNLYKTRHAFRESISDTALAFAMNVPIGFGIIAFANAIGIITVTTSENVQLVILQNIVFTTVPNWLKNSQKTLCIMTKVINIFAI